MNDETLTRPARNAAVYALAASPAYQTDGVCFAATVGGLLRSPDRGKTFEDAYASLELPESRCQPPRSRYRQRSLSDRTVFAGRQRRDLALARRGATWQYAELRTPPPVVTCLAVSPAYEEDGIVFAGTLQDGVFRTADRGGRWASWNFGLIDLGRALPGALACVRPRTTRLSWARRRDCSAAPTAVGRGVRSACPPILRRSSASPFLLTTRKTTALFAGTESNGLWMSDDRGTSWQPVESLGPVAINALIVTAGEGSLALTALLEDELRVSEDGGADWRSLPLDLPEDVAAVCLAAPEGLGPGRSVLLGCSDGEVRKVML